MILHPGFHKTGTSSLQACLAANRAALAPHAQIVLLDALERPVRYATRFATGGDPLDLAGFSAAFAEVCATVTGADTVVISCEGLSGRTPGKKGIVDYGAAVPLAQAMAAGVRTVFGGKARLTFLYTTREAQGWLSSAWRHNLSGYRVTEDFDTFSARCAEAADFAAITGQVAQTVQRAEVIQVALESVQTAPLGPAEAVLALLDLPGAARAGLVNPGVRNVGSPAELSAALLALNRSDLSDEEVKRRKAALSRPGTAPRLG